MAKPARILRDQFFLSMLVVCAVLLMARLAYLYLANPENFPISTFKIEASYQHITRKTLEGILEKYTHKGFFSISVRDLRTELADLYWTDTVDVARIWPDTLKIKVIEKRPVAIWNHVLMTADGLLFDLSPAEWQKEANAEHLPELNGPKNQQLDVLQMFQKLSKLSETFGLHANSLALRDNRAWELGLTNGVLLRLGKQDVESRLQRFCLSYSVVFGDKLEQLAVVDLRYVHGMAAQWKDTPK
ncbi:MAG: cell division protein FtsQ/DivIB [Legionellaceae bacterium]|nr:cell division protein FtsQ/DivIB [Legionellaceae bacterium]MBP9775222.1 cell division protein FtsQ/DivIB [Legionellaceae bacterium]